jgi:hypothetical protein
LREELRQPKAALGRHAGNSSLPPSAKLPQAPPPVVKPKTGRRTGAERGHPPHLRLSLPPGRVRHSHRFVPGSCRRCHHPLSAERGPDAPPTGK